MENYLVKIRNAQHTINNRWKETDWELVSYYNGILVERKLFEDCPIYNYRIDAVIEKSYEELANELWNMTEEKYQKYDKTVVKYEVHESGEVHCASQCDISHHQTPWRLMTLRSNLGWPIAQRETLGFQIKKHSYTNSGERHIWLISVSVEDDRYPPDASIVRTNMHFTATCLENMDSPLGKRTRYTKMVSIDPCGYIPSSVVNLFAGNFANVVELLREG